MAEDVWGQEMSRITSGLMSSNTDEWPIPHYLYDKLDNEFHFTLDVCATDLNHKAPEYYTKEDDGLKQDWQGTCWMNPPYGRTIGDWVKKAYESARGGGSCGLPFARKDGYALVEGLRNGCQRVEVHFWKGQVR